MMFLGFLFRFKPLWVIAGLFAVFLGGAFFGAMHTQDFAPCAPHALPPPRPAAQSWFPPPGGRIP